MRLRLTLLISMLLGLGLLVFCLGGAPSVADGSTTEGAGPRGREHGAQEQVGSVTTEAGSDAGLTGRRLTGLAEELVGRLSQTPPAPNDEQTRAAAQLVALFNEFDLEAAGGLFNNPALGHEEWVQWLRQRVGACQLGEPMVVRDGRVRYLLPCEHGQLEAEFELDPDTGKIPRLIMGARDVGLADPVREAAEAVMRLYDEWDPELFERTFIDKFEAEKMRQFFLDVRSVHGDCSLGEPDLVSVRGTLIHLECERGRRLMKVELMQEEDRIRTLWIRDPRPGR